MPWDPTGAIVGPLGIAALFFGRKKKGSKAGTFLVLVLVIGSVGMTLGACQVDNPTGEPVHLTATQTPGSPTATVVLQTPTAISTLTVTPPAPIETLVPTCTLTVGEGTHERTLPYGGNEVMALYNKMKDYSDGWWQKHPDQSQYKFTFEVFIGMMIIHEGNNQDITENLVAELVSQQLYVGSWNPAYCSMGQCSQHAAANQWAAQSQSIHGLIDKYVRGGTDIREYTGSGGHGIDRPNTEIETAWKMGNKALHPSSLNLDVDNALSVCGNDLDWVREINKAALDPANEMKRYAYKEYRDGNPRSIYYFTGVNDGAAVFASINQQNCWKYQKNCYVVPNPVIVYNPATGNFGDN